jgi:hypothetical protein
MRSLSPSSKETAMKKSTCIELVLITAALASCNQSQPKSDWEENSKVHVRSDSTAPYTTRAIIVVPASVPLYYGTMLSGRMVIINNGAYSRAGYYSGAISPLSNIGSNGFKGAVTRGGFGRGGYSVGG